MPLERTLGLFDVASGIASEVDAAVGQLSSKFAVLALNHHLLHSAAVASSDTRGKLLPHVLYARNQDRVILDSPMPTVQLLLSRLALRRDPVRGTREDRWRESDSCRPRDERRGAFQPRCN